MSMRTLWAIGLATLIGACVQTGSVTPSAAQAVTAPWMQTRAHLPDNGPPVDADGFYDSADSCPGEGCQISAWQSVSAATPLREAPTRTARVVATIAAGEWVRATNRSVNRVRPARGVVVGETHLEYEHDRLNVGDVVYTLDYEGEGYVVLWRRGDSLSWEDTGDDGGIRWDPRDEAQAAADEAGGGGWWVQVRRANGESGWVPGGALTCIDGQDPTDECRARNSR